MIYLSKDLSIYMYIFLSIYLSIYLSIDLSTHPEEHQLGLPEVHGGEGGVLHVRQRVSS